MKITKNLWKVALVVIGGFIIFYIVPEVLAWRRTTFQLDKKITVIGLPKCLASIGQNITNESDCYTGFYGIETKRVYQISDSSCKHFPSPLDSNKGLFIVKGIFREKLVSGKHLEGVGSLEVVSYKRILGKLYPWEKNDPCLK